MTDQNETPIEPTTAGPILSAKWYERGKWFVLIFLPAFGVFYGGSAVLFGLPYGEQVVSFSSLLALFIGTVIGVSNRNFQKSGADGSINARIEGNQVVLSKLALPNIAPEELATKKTVTIQVNPNSQ